MHASPLSLLTLGLLAGSAVATPVQNVRQKREGLLGYVKTLGG